jgi:ferrous iron transport protein A
MQERDIPGAASARAVIPLRALPVGRVARLAEPPPGCQIPRRLGDLGFTPGTELRVVRRAPLGDPVEIEIRGYRLCLRLEQLDELVVEADSHGEGQ